jgi:hypothetical protein
LGNPPYGPAPNAQQPIRKFLDERDRFRVDASNIVNYFISLGIDCLKVSGSLGLVVPKSISYSGSYSPTRKTVAESASLKWVIDLGVAFEGVGLEQIIFVCEKSKASTTTVSVATMSGSEISFGDEVVWSRADQEESWPIYLFGNRLALANKIKRSSARLDDLTSKTDRGGIFRGLPLQGKKSLLHEESTAADDKRAIVGGKNVSHYTIWPSSDERIYFVSPDELPSAFDNAVARQEVPRIGVKRLSSSIVKIEAAYLDRNTLNFDTVVNVVLDDWDDDFAFYLIGWLNSDLAAWYMKWSVFNNAVLSISYDSDYLGRLPIPQWTAAPWQMQVSTAARVLTAKEVRKFRKGVTNYLEVKGSSHFQINEVFKNQLNITESERILLSDILPGAADEDE